VQIKFVWPILWRDKDGEICALSKKMEGFFEWNNTQECFSMLLKFLVCEN